MGSAGSAPASGVIVQALGKEKGEILRSSRTNEKGLFDLHDLPPGTYALTFKTEQATWTGSTPVTIGPREEKALLVTLDPAQARSPRRRNRRDAAASAGEDDEDDSKGLTLWNNPFVAAITIIATAALLGEVIDDGDGDEASPSSP